MDATEFKKLKSTFPWSYRIDKTKSGGFVRIFNNKGTEIDLITLVELVVFLTIQLREKNEKRENLQE